ncbi:MAG: hypothetical protein A2X36_16265 [Elusimicrobia bacterium GWA2_69_24]|nr:MAG: hypothetical protein A2X36_16265 [Elusimicrobia bacterium GWA2_69_24]
MPPNILVIRLSSLGDVVLTAPVFKNLKAHWPDARICVLVKPQFAPVLQANPCVDEVLPFRGLFQTLQDIRARRFTHLLDLHATLRTFLIRNLAAVPNVSVYRKHALARRLYVLFRWSSPALAKHSLDRYLESLSAWGVPIVCRDLALGDYGSGKGKLPPPSPARVLLVQTSFLGDALLTLPLARRIKQQIPGCRLTVLTRPETVSVFRRDASVDEVLADDKRGAQAGVSGLWGLARDLRSRGFDLAFVAHRSLRSALLVWLARIPHRVGFSSSAGAFLFHQTVAFPWGMPEVERNLALLLALKPGLRAERGDALYLKGPAPAAPSGDASDEVGLRERLRREGVEPGQVLVGIHPGSVWETKRWLPERFARLTARLTREAGARVVFIGGAGDPPLVAGILALAGVPALSGSGERPPSEDRAPLRPALDWTGKTTLPELMLLASRLDLLITNDSGPMHIAAASGVPTIALFGPTTRELGFFPYGDGHRVVEKDLACRPCGLHGSRRCPEGHFLCMRLIGVDEVFRHARELLAGRAASSPREENSCAARTAPPGAPS